MRAAADLLLGEVGEYGRAYGSTTYGSSLTPRGRAGADRRPPSIRPSNTHRRTGARTPDRPVNRLGSEAVKVRIGDRFGGGDKYAPRLACLDARLKTGNSCSTASASRTAI
jgi:hypothetical protein